MFTIRLVGLSTLLLLSSVSFANKKLEPSYPSVPSSYEVLSPSKLISTAKVDFAAYVIDYTNGYKVTAPNGTEFIVDNIAQPKCAFYASYVGNDDNGFLGISGGTTVTSNVYIGEVNFANCQ